MQGETTACDCITLDSEGTCVLNKNCSHQRADYWKNLINLHPYFHNPRFLREVEASPTRTPANTLNVTASIASVCVEARYKRMNLRYLKTTIKQFGKLSTEKMKEIRECLITVSFWHSEIPEFSPLDFRRYISLNSVSHGCISRENTNPSKSRESRRCFTIWSRPSSKWNPVSQPRISKTRRSEWKPCQICVKLWQKNSSNFFCNNFL